MLARQRTPAHGVNCTACRETSNKYERALQTLGAGKGVLGAVPEGLPSPQHAKSAPAAGKNPFCSAESKGVEITG